ARGGATERARRPHRQGQGRQLHGERSRVALQVARRTTARPRAGRARGGPMRGAFRDAICELAAADERIWLLTGDLGYTVLEPFYERFPARFVNVGVAEQNMTGVAAGLSCCARGATWSWSPSEACSPTSPRPPSGSRRTASRRAW